MKQDYQKEHDEMLFKRKAQAATEFAVLGSLIIIAFAALISYSEKLNRQQAYIQQTFRMALATSRSYGVNRSASYTKVAFRRMPNVGSPMELGQLQSFSNSANVLWANGKSTAPQGVTRYQLNEAPAIDIPPAATPINTTRVNINTFTNDMDADYTFVKTEAGGVITTNRMLSATDILNANVTIGGALYTFTQSVDEEILLPSGEEVGGKYYTGNSGILTRSRLME